jgi:hypothetical protein
MRFGLGDNTIVEKKRTVVSPKIPSFAPTPTGHPSPTLYYVMALPFLGLLLYLGIYMYRVQLNAKMLEVERPVLSQYRPLRIEDLNPFLIQQLEHRYPKPVEIRLEKYQNRVLLRIYSHDKVALQRPPIYGDLAPDEILQHYYDKTGDRADSIKITYRKGVPYLFIYSSDDMP